MKQVRRGVFETNSSSTHSITICTEDEYTRFRRGELLFDKWNDVFVEKSEVSEDDDGVETYKEYMDDYYLESYTEHFTAPSGDKIVVFGKYGYNG